MKLNTAFEADIVEHPDDDAPRLVYADWLDEHGEHNRAEFIRVQIELTRVGEYDDHSPELLRRQRELLLSHGETWAKPTRKFTRTGEFERGFIGRMTMTAGKFLREATLIFAACPLRELWVMQLRREVEAFAQCPQVARLRALNLGYVRLGARRIARLVGSEHVSALQELNLTGTEMRVTGMRAVFASPHLTGLRSLRLGSNFVGPEWGSAFARARGLTNLTALSLAGNGLDAEAASQLALAQHAAQLEELDLRDNVPLGDEGVRRLFAPGTLRRLRKLNLSNTRLGRSGIETIAAAPLDALLELDLGRQDADLGLVELAHSPHLKNLRVLGLEYSRHIKDEDARALATATFLPRLRVLRLPRMSPKGLHLVLQAQGLAGVQRLKVTTDHQHDGRAAMELVAAGHLTRLTHLDLSFCRPDLAGLKQLCQCPRVAGLLELDLSFSRYEERVYRVLIDSPYLTRWCHVRLRGNESPSPDVRIALRERFAQVEMPTG